MADPDRLTKAVCQDIASRQRYLPGPQAIADVLGQLMARRGYARIQAANDLGQAWATAVGEALAAASLPGNLRRGVLNVIVANSAALQELTFIKRTLIKELKRLAPDQKIRDVRFRIGPIDRG
jgi:predicted nucleic acid-binding Zn ribbon protein